MKALRTLSALLQRSGLAQALGKQFGGKRELYDIFGYSKTLQFNDLMAKYQRQDIAARILEAPASAIWSNPPMITSTDEAWNVAWRNLVQRHNLYFILNRLDLLAGLGRYAVLYIGFSGGGLSADKPDEAVKAFKAPVDPTIAAPTDTGRDVLYFQPYAEPAITIVQLNDNKSSPRYMLPEIYDLKPFANSPQIGTTPIPVQSTMRVHASRCLHVCEGSLEDTIIGRPRMERVANLLDDMIKISGGTGETYWLTANRGMQADIDKELELTPEDEKALTDELDEYQHQLRRWIRTRGVKINNLGSDVPDPRGAFGITLSLLAGASGIPQRVMTGAEAGQLASEQDRANWAERVEERRRLFAEPIVLWPLIRLLTDAGVLPSKEGMKITVEWPSAFRMSPLEEAQTRAQQARSAVNLSRTLKEQYDMRQSNMQAQQDAQSADTSGGVDGASTNAPPDPKAQAKDTKAKDKTKAKDTKTAQPGSDQVQTGPFGQPIAPQPKIHDPNVDEIFITVPEARHFVGLEKSAPTFDDKGDVSKPAGAK